VAPPVAPGYIAQIPVIQSFGGTEIVGGEAEVIAALPASTGIAARLSEYLGVRHEDIVQPQYRTPGRAHAVGAVPLVADGDAGHVWANQHHHVVLQVVVDPVNGDEHHEPVSPGAVGGKVLDTVDAPATRFAPCLGLHHVHADAVGFAAHRGEQ